ncbi:hypothetical protein K439DRAFT_1324399 [Ramaria rubella]|nr:hypothetical protein K439DRAFT_1324399 [Ramaria rubella]
MAKSLRSKTKRAFRKVKRESGVFATADAARMHRLSSKLRAKLGTDGHDDDVLEEKETEEGWCMELDSSAPKKISTSGRRLSRRDAWRLSKGKPIHTKNPDKVNRLGGVAAKRRAGRSKRRR